MKSAFEGSVALTALAAEARRRGITYGHLVGETTFEERERIIREYQEEKREEKRRGREAAGREKKQKKKEKD